jgi:porphobilinogen synthase
VNAKPKGGHMNKLTTLKEHKIGSSHLRPRRLRIQKNIQQLTQEHWLQKCDFIAPVFVSEPGTQRQEILNLPGISRIPFDELLQEIEEIQNLGILGVMLFPVVSTHKKTLTAEEAYHPDALMPTCFREIKKHFPQLLVFADVALDPFTSHGHDGILNEQNHVLNDETVQILCQQALSYARSGADFVCPSDMMDGRVGALRHALDAEGFVNTGIVAYSAKYASAFYGPFREALKGEFLNLDKTSYQLNPANGREALREIRLDLNEGADLILIKPALPYLDIIFQAKKMCDVPVVAYHVSGEYALLKHGAMHHVIDEKKAVLETLLSIKRAGADVMITYYAKWLCQHILK